MPNLRISRTKMNRPVTMHDVALRVGVSKQTVSAVINGKPGITPETTSRVRSVIEELGYYPNQSARSLVTGRTNTIALFIIDVSLLNLGKMASVADDYASTHHYNLIIYNTRSNNDRELAYINAALRRSVDGILFMSANDLSVGPQMLLDAKVPIVAIARRPRTYTGPFVALDYVHAGNLAADYLLELGHRQLAHIAGPADIHTSNDRMRGFQETLSRRKTGVLVGHEVADGWEPASGYKAMKSLITRNTGLTAVFAAGDGLALGAMRAVAEAGLRVPEDISVVGGDNNDQDTYLNPPLTTIDMDLPQTAEIAMQMLLKIIEGQPLKESEQHILLEPKIVIRQSAANPPGFG